MATSGNMTTVPAASITLKPTPAGSGLTAEEWTGIGIGFAGAFIALIGIILALLRFKADDIRKRLREWRRRERPRHSPCQEGDGEQQLPLKSLYTASEERRRHSRSQEEDSEQRLPLNTLYTASAGETNGTRSKAEQTRAERDAESRCGKVLKEIYLTTGSYVQMRPWVDDDKMHIMDIYTKLQLEKDDIDLKGEVKSYWDIFKLKSKAGHPIQRAILRGSAGLGKTTLLVKIAYDWACGTVAALKKYKLVFVLKMHSLQQRSDVIDALFDQLLDEKTINREDLKHFITANPDDVLFLLDGFNEFKSTELDEREFGSILNMLNRKGDYEKCGVLVTTRPSHYDRLVKNTLIQKPLALVNVLGFNKNDIQKYVYKYFAGESVADGLLERIASSCVLSDLASSPMLLLFLCLLWRESATLHETMFRLYNQTLRYIFKRKAFLSKEEISMLVFAIGKVALDGLLSLDQKLSFHEEDFEPDVLYMAIRAGILTSQRVRKEIDIYKSVHFIHKTFQEFCAAVYFQKLMSERETKPFQVFFRQESDLRGFEYLLRFCCGDHAGPGTNSILNIISHKVKHAGDLNDNNLLIALKCYFESQSHTLPPLELIDSVIASNLTADNNLSQDDVTSFMYFLGNVSQHTKDKGSAFLERITLLRITVSNFFKLGPDFLNYVNRMANLCCFYVTRERGQSEYQRDSHWAHLDLKAMRQLRTVGFNGCTLTSRNMGHIVEELSNLPNLVELDLSFNQTIAGSDRSLSVLTKMKHLQKLTLIGCDLTAHDQTQINDALSPMTTVDY